MKSNLRRLHSGNRAFFWLAVGVLSALSLPLLLMIMRVPLYDPGSGFELIDWNLFDFVAMAGLMFLAGTALIFAARKFPRRIFPAAILIALVFLWIWAELAVGIFTTWGS